MDYPVPFIKWAGGKSKYIGQLKPFFPSNFRAYIEPFLGSGAVFFDVLRRLQPAICVLADLNEDLIRCYEVVRHQHKRLVKVLETHRQNHSGEYYYAVRSQSPKMLSPVEAAARFIYLNKTCFNGLYRVNRFGEFNVPIGRYKNPKICESVKLAQASQALSKATLQVGDFETVTLFTAKPNDFVYFDPPYQPISATAHFTKYTTTSFGRGDQIRLSEVYKTLDQRGCHVMLSNSDSELIRSLYSGYRIETLQATRSISSNPMTRGRVNELIILNY